MYQDSIDSCGQHVECVEHIHVPDGVTCSSGTGPGGYDLLSQKVGYSVGTMMNLEQDTTSFVQQLSVRDDIKMKLLK